jgi:hypothetical protein
MVGSVMGFALVYNSGNGWREVVEVTFEECAQGAFVDCVGESTFAVIGAQGHVFSLTIVLVWC